MRLAGEAERLLPGPDHLSSVKPYSFMSAMNLIRLFYFAFFSNLTTTGQKMPLSWKGVITNIPFVCLRVPNKGVLNVASLKNQGSKVRGVSNYEKTCSFQIFLDQMTDFCKIMSSFYRTTVVIHFKA